MGQDFFQLGVIDDISVVGHHDAEGGADEKRPGVFSSAAAECGVARVTDAYVPREALDVFDGKDVPDEAVSFFGVEAPVIGGDPGGILAAVLDG